MIKGLFCVLAGTLAIACGSDSESNGPSGDAGLDGASGFGGSSSGGSSTGGTSTGGSSTGGSPSTGGTSSGGTSTGGTSSGGTSSGGSSTGGASGDASAPVDGGADATTDGPAATACEQLQTCCDNLGAGSALQPSCQQQVDTGMEANCSVVMGLFCGQVSTDGGLNVDAGATCQDLSTCCASLPSAQQADCTTIAGLGSAQICGLLLSSYQQSGGC